jgi:hypothetical protein
MSRLIFEGDTISRFGKKIPTPFIEKIKIFEDHIEPTISIYLHITEDDATNQEIYTDLSNLYLHSGFMRIRTIPEQLSLGETFILVSDQIYNSQAKRFAKFTYSPSQEYGTIVGTTIDRLERALTRTSKRDTYYSCFISVAEDDDLGSQNSSLTTQNDSSGEIGEIDERGAYARYSNISSPLVYEKVITAPLSGTGNNRLATDPVVIYEDDAGLPYESVSLQSIQKGFYKTTETFREQLKKEIDNLVASYGTTEDQQLQSLLDSISFIAQTKSEDVDFIVELDKVRNSFPSRTSTSAVGTLYNRLKDILFSANDALLLGEGLQKKLVPNTKLISFVGLESQNRQISWSSRSATTYSPRPDGTGQYLYNRFFMERQELEVDKLFRGEVYDSGVIQEPNYDVVRNFGYFFFDYEKALHKKSNISQIYPVQKLLNLFGNNSLDGYFQISRTELLRFDNDKDIVNKIVSFYSNNLTSTSARLPGRGDSVSQIVFKPSSSPDGTATSSGIIEKNYVVLRKFDTAIGLEGYRLLAFEYQDLQRSSTATSAGQSYRFNIEIEDKTIDFYDLLRQQIENAIQELLTYLEFAQEFCSFNNIDGRFNDFFIKGINEQFPENPPWTDAALIYAVHLDLIENQFNGDFQLIKSYAHLFSDAYLNPHTTTLSILENKINLIVDFYEKYYGDAGIITREADNLPDPDGIPTGRNLRDNVDLVFTNGYDNFADIVDFTPDYEPLIIRRWNGNEEIFNPQEAKDFIAEKMTQFIVAGSLPGPPTPSRVLIFSPDELIGLVNGDITHYTATDYISIGGPANAQRKYKSKNEKSARRIYNFIIHMLGSMGADRGGNDFTYQKRKDAINYQIDRLENDSNSDLPSAYKDLKNAEEEFIRNHRAILGNIALFYIKAERTATFDPYRFITNTFAGIQGRT